MASGGRKSPVGESGGLRPPLAITVLVFLFLAGCSGSGADAPARKTVVSGGQAFILGIVEGVTEFLPVSSTGHLALSSQFLGLRDETDLSPDQIKAIKAYEIVIQFGAILAVFMVYAERIGHMALGLAGRSPSGQRLLVNLICAFIPTAAIGLTLEKLGVIEKLQYGLPVVFATFLGGVLMILFERSHRASKSRSSGDRLEALTPYTAFLIGLIQCLAMWPGTSRSMVTIVGGMLLGLGAVAAAEFSFLLGLATLSAATFWKLIKEGAILREHIGVDVMLTGLVVAMIAAMIAISAFIGYLNRRGLEPFGWYRLALAIVMIFLLGSGKL